MAQILDLSTTQKPKNTIAVDGKEYALRFADDLSLVELVRMDAIEVRVKLIGTKTDNTEEEAQALEDDLNAYVGEALEKIPEDVVKALHWSQKLQIMRVFMNNGKVTKVKPSDVKTKLSPANEAPPVESLAKPAPAETATA